MTREEIKQFAKEHHVKLSVTWWEDEGVIWLNRIIVPKKSRGEGLGGQILEMLKQYCDENGLVMKLLADSCYGTEIHRLVNYYKKHGFKEYREPEESQRNHYLKYTPKKARK